MKSMGYDRLIQILGGGAYHVLYFNDSWGGGSNLTGIVFSTNQHLPAVQEKVTIKPSYFIILEF